MSAIAWTPKEEKMLKEIVNRGYTTKEAKLVFVSRSEDSIYRKARRMGMHLRFTTSEIDEAAFKKLIKERRI
jgi:hypothetical protein